MPPRTDLTFRIATSEEIELLLTLMEALYQHEEHPFDRERTRRAVSSLLQSPVFGHIWLMECDDRTVGYVVLTYGFSMEFGGRDALLDELFIVEPQRKRGFGRQALEFVFDQCRKQNIRALHVEVFAENEKAAAIYSRFGFGQDARRLMTKWLD